MTFYIVRLDSLFYKIHKNSMCLLNYGIFCVSYNVACLFVTVLFLLSFLEVLWLTVSQTFLECKFGAQAWKTFSNVTLIAGAVARANTSHTGLRKSSEESSTTWPYDHMDSGPNTTRRVTSYEWVLRHPILYPYRAASLLTEGRQSGSLEYHFFLTFF